MSTDQSNFRVSMACCVDSVSWVKVFAINSTSERHLSIKAKSLLWLTASLSAIGFHVGISLVVLANV